MHVNPQYQHTPSKSNKLVPVPETPETHDSKLFKTLHDLIIVNHVHINKDRKKVDRQTHTPSYTHKLSLEYNGTYNLTVLS